MAQMRKSKIQQNVIDPILSKLQSIPNLPLPFTHMNSSLYPQLLNRMNAALMHACCTGDSMKFT